MNTYLGEIAALITSLCFSITSTFFTLAGQKVGSVIVNRTRLGIAVVFILSAHFLLRIPLPCEIETDRLFWLGLSGIIGLVLGDASLFQAFILIDPRISILLMGLPLVIATILAWLFLVFRQPSLFSYKSQWTEHFKLCQAFFHPEIKQNFHA